MSGKIGITPEAMRGRAAEYASEATAVGESIQRMDILLSNLQVEWEGPASQSYAQRYAELRKSF